MSRNEGAKVRFQGNYDDIEAIAGRLYAKIPRREGEYARPWLDRIVTALGGKVHDAFGMGYVEPAGGSLVIRRGGSFDIFLPPFTRSLRDNFTQAHEIGHYLLHYVAEKHTDPQPVLFQRYGSNIYEWQANRFAAALLMPKEKFREAFERRDGDLVLVAGDFDVSASAAEVRAETLGLKK